MRRMLATVEVQRVLILAFAVWMLTGAYMGHPFLQVVAEATGAALWTLLLGWSFTLHTPWALVARIGLTAGVVAHGAATLGAELPVLLAVVAGAGLLAGAGERLAHRSIAA